jgi:hypothetical protein
MAQDVKKALLPKKATSGRINVEEKKQRLKLWLEYCENNRREVGCDPPKGPFEKKHGWPAHTVRRLLESREKLEEENSGLPQQWSRIVKRPLFVLEVVLVEVLKDVRSRRIPVDAILLRALAHDTYTVLQNRMGVMPFPRPEFGKSWRELFKDAWGIQYFKMDGEADSVDLQLIQPAIAELISIIAEYPLEDVYNADETGLFLQAMAPWTLDFLRKSGIKSVSSRISILFCVNATGTDKLKPFILSELIFFFFFFLLFMSSLLT